jgi:hypothetical protein
LTVPKVVLQIAALVGVVIPSHVVGAAATAVYEHLVVDYAAS